MFTFVKKEKIWPKQVPYAKKTVNQKKYFLFS